MMNWYYAIEGHSHGPVPEEKLAALAHEGLVSTDTLVWHPGLDEWEPVWKIKPEVIGLLNNSGMARKAKGATTRITLSVQAPAGASNPGILGKLSGLFKKRP